ncbi:hypothetical protein BO78DRAFT_418219 [Aspergillus sclerotiicarbonarius CBS 121057]|uniref:Cyanovirin-N domain-containing protein n=1 Tax=Aspergillus sclerotiicarbonarius (strain CBS 121057 / IBT 28362) TaxID=1448318 RepID=A0A319EBJ3_ASPSB|nr:hypothetical protein BO78DRAFT_418219 [Aspergillus sclerotiicarbonarius CBS 121057]
MRHHILPILLTLTLPLPLPTTAASTITAQIRPSFHNTCPPTDTTNPDTHTPTTDTTTNTDTSTDLHPRTHNHQPIPIPPHHHHNLPTIPIHPDTCQSITITPSTTTHVSFDTQIQGTGAGTEHCNVTLHERPGCVDTPLLVTRVTGEEVGDWVGSECAERSYLSGSENGVGAGDVWVMMECTGGFGAGAGNEHGDEEDGGNVHANEDGQREDGTGTGSKTTQQQQSQQGDDKGTRVGTMHGGLVNSTGLHGGLVNSTGLHGANWNATMGRMNVTLPIAGRMLGRRNWRRRFLRY